MFPIGWVMVFLLWAYFMIVYRPERAAIPGLRERARELYRQLGPITAKEIQAAVIVVTAVTVMSLRSFIPALKQRRQERASSCSPRCCSSCSRSSTSTTSRTSPGTSSCCSAVP